MKEKILVRRTMALVMGAAGAGLLLVAAAAAAPALPNVHVTGPAQIVFRPDRDGCDGNDVPDAPLRAYRDAAGDVVAFGLHYTNHGLRGPSFDTLKIVCRSALLSQENPDPTAYDDRSWITATWTRDGRIVDALVHHEYQANAHPGRCRFPDYMQCWFNTVLAARSADGGASFAKVEHPVVASAPFGQDREQGRHRGFFNPSNIVSDGQNSFMLASTTGWAGQPSGVCLFRTHNPDDSGAWRAYDGQAFTIRYEDPYHPPVAEPKPCATIAPFPAPVGSVVRQRGSGLWIAVFQAAGDAGRFPVSGFYTAVSSDLLRWSEPRLLMSGTTNYDDPCRSGGHMIAYPSMVDPGAPGRNFDTVGTTADLYFAALRVDGCTITANRELLRLPLTLNGAATERLVRERRFD